MWFINKINTTTVYNLYYKMFFYIYSDMSLGSLVDKCYRPTFWSTEKLTFKVTKCLGNKYNVERRFTVYTATQRESKIVQTGHLAVALRQLNNLYCGMVKEWLVLLPPSKKDLGVMPGSDMGPLCVEFKRSPHVCSRFPYHQKNVSASFTLVATSIWLRHFVEQFIEEWQKKASSYK